MKYFQIGKSAKKRLFQADDYNGSLSSNYSSLQKSRSNATTLERTNSKSPKLSNQKLDRLKKPPKTQLSPEQLKAQLEQTILEDHKQNMKNKHEKMAEAPAKIEMETQKTENKFQKFGIRVLPTEQQQKSPKTAELSQNDNNINIERYTDNSRTTATPMETAPKIGIDEVDKSKDAPAIKKREKIAKSPERLPDNETANFVRQNSLNGSGIKRDINGIPQEIPNHMLNAAVAARNNRRSSMDNGLEKEDSEGSKTPKKQKGKAPAPPEASEGSPDKNHFYNANDAVFDLRSATPVENLNKTDDSMKKRKESPKKQNSKNGEDYNSDSDAETTNESSVNTIELNSSDITIHQIEDTDELQNRKTASTGDLSKIHKTPRSGTGTLERAQSLDITDTSMPSLTKKRKAGRIEDMFDSKTNSDDSLYGNALIHKEPRLSLILDGLNTFQRSRLKKSTEWGNLEDAILKLNKENNSGSSLEKFNSSNSDEDFNSTFEFHSKSPEFDALVNKINEIKQEIPEKTDEKASNNVNIVETVIDTAPKLVEVATKPERKMKNQIWPTFETIDVTVTENDTHKNSVLPTLPAYKPKIDNGDVSPASNNTKLDGVIVRNREPAWENVNNAVKSNSDTYQKSPTNDASKQTKLPSNSASEESETILPNQLDASREFLYAERFASNNDGYRSPHTLDDINVSDDIKVSRHSLGSLERPKAESGIANTSYNAYNTKVNDVSNISSITINDKTFDEDAKNYRSFEISFNKDQRKEPTLSTSELYTTALDDTVKLDGIEMIADETPDLVKDVNEIIIEGPTSLTFEIPADNVEIMCKKVCVDLEPVINKESGEKEKCNLENSSCDLMHVSNNSEENLKGNSTLTYITEIQVTPNSTNNTSNVSEIEIIPNINSTHNTNNETLDNKFENYVKNFETNVKNFELNLQAVGPNVQEEGRDLKSATSIEAIDAEKELNKIQEIVEEQLKKLPEMRFSTSSYEGSKTPEKRQSQIELLRSNFEKSPPKSTKTEINTSKSRIPIATSMKTPPTSPERRDSRNLDLEPDKDLIAIMSSSIHSTPAPTGLKYQSKGTNKNVTVTSIRSNSKIPSGLPSLAGSRPPVPPRKSETREGDSSPQVSTNGASENSFKQWVFNPSSSVTNIVVVDSKNDHK